MAFDFASGDHSPVNETVNGLKVRSDPKFKISPGPIRYSLFFSANKVYSASDLFLENFSTASSPRTRAADYTVGWAVTL